jgi:acyl transferase domain-containing protein
MADEKHEYNGTEIAIVGMACRFPGARDAESFWQNLRHGVESVSRLSDDELLRMGVDPALLRRPNYVRAAQVVEDMDRFDAGFFGYNAIEARLIDPQQRLFLECCWHALEDAGCDPARTRERIGVYAGSKTNTYLYHLASNPELLRTIDFLQLVLTGDQALLSTRISYKLGLRGPSYAVQTACSSSLVAVHLACQSLLIDECRTALAGGVAIMVPDRVGYLYEEGSILSPDGHCRPFDAKARGTVFGSGVGVVVLKRLEDALADGDHVYALIRGSATNNDGADKASFTAPSVEGQAEVVLEALAAAGVDADSISYVEAHGTGTPLGDPIEVLALTQAYRASTERREFCALGSVKSNIGHLDAAAGMASLLKTVLAIDHAEIPPTLHYEEPNPGIDFAASPFRVADRLSPWETEGPRRAGVSSFGFGGTNAHLILEEAPPRPAAAPSRPWQLLMLSARTPEALDEATGRLAAHFEAHPETDLADAAWTLRVGRREHEHRRISVAPTDSAARQEAVAALRGGELPTGSRRGSAPAVGMLFSGQGSQHVGMGRELYRSEPVYRREFDRCRAILQPLLGIDLLSLDDPARMQQTALAQPALFALEWSLAHLWMEWGVRPRAVAGHSIGEYVAACLAGVFSLEDALALVAERGRLMQELPAGAMLAVALPEAELAPRLDGDLALAAVNGPADCVVAGPEAAVEALAERLMADGVKTRRLHTSHAFHSAMMDPVLDRFTERVRRVRLAAPQIPCASNLTGDWLTAEQATDPGYWARHLRGTVRFADNVAALLGPCGALLEVGPGTALATLARRHPARGEDHVVLSSLPHPDDRRPEDAYLLGALGQLWIAGAEIDWDAFQAGEKRQRVSLPGYPFARERHWVDAPAGSARTIAVPERTRVTLDKKPDVGDWFYLPAWRPAEAPPVPAAKDLAGSWLLFADEAGVAELLAARLRDAGAAVTLARFGELDGAESYDRLLGELARQGQLPSRIVHLWSLTDPRPDADRDELMRRGFGSLLPLFQALGRQPLTAPVGVVVVSNGVQAVTGTEALEPEKATLLGPCKVVGKESAVIACRSVDLDASAAMVAEDGAWIDRLLAEAAAGAGPADASVAWRAEERLAEAFEPARREETTESGLREEGVYLITGGLGGVGLVLAEDLARGLRARLVLTGRGGLPPREEWEARLAAGGPSAERIRKVRELEAHGAEVLAVAADVTDAARMREVAALARERFGILHGVIHAAGLAGGGLLQVKRPEAAAAVLDPKVRGARVLAEVFTGDTADTAGQPLDFLVFLSSLQTVLADFGQADYAGANAFLDTFAGQLRAAGVPALAMDWDNWREVGLLVDSEMPEHLRPWQEELLAQAITPAEGAEAFRRALGAPGARIAISTQDLPGRIELSRAFAGGRILVELGLAAPPATVRPERRAAAGAAAARPGGGELERRIREVWQRVLSVGSVGLHDNFFDLGGNSLTGMQLIGELNRELDAELSPIHLFDAPTVAALAKRLAPAESPEPVEDVALTPRPVEMEGNDGDDGWGIAIIGMAGRFPGAANVDELWRNLRDGVESIRFFSEEELLAVGVPAELVKDPRYVRARAVLDGADLFDATFFGVSQREAEIMDPQHRLFLECAWEALESAGHDPETVSGPVGVFAGSSISSYLQNLYANPEVLNAVGEVQALIANEKDSLPMRVSYKLNLRGPSLAVQTYCSTSLVAIHLACRSLLAGECDMALAGGVSITVPQTSGYLYDEGSFASGDGHVRTFDAKAQGIVNGNGLGAVVLKPLRRALADGDHVHAVIRGAAVNNDGSLKVGYLAPSGEGQVAVVQAALREARCHPDSIGYVECHGTGTPLGDPIEVAALARAWRTWTERTGDCPIGSVKTNFGHLDRAAGVTSLIKTVLALEHGEIPATLHFEEPNPKIDFASSPFYVNAALSPWPANGDRPRRAGVSAMGVGGTNAHVIVEEAPAVPAGSASRPWQLLVLSARTPAALDAATANLATHLKTHPGLSLPDAAFTLQVGRRAFANRRALVCRGAEEAVEILESGDLRRFAAGVGGDEPPRPVFLFPGLGAQYVDMGRGLYRDEPVFREALDRCCELFQQTLGVDLREVLYPRGVEGEGEDAAPAAGGGVDLRRMLRQEKEPEDAATSRLKQTFLSQPAVFAIEYALARLWMEWGVQPEAMAGYSVGELTAACLAGVLTLEDAAALVARRAQLIQEMPEGAMTAVPLPEERVLPLLGDELSLAGVNGPGQTVVAGPLAAIDAFEEKLDDRGLICRRLQTTHAFHSRMLQPAFDALVELVRTFDLRAPRIPYLSNVTGTWITAEEATDPAYWARHMVQPVRFADIAAELLSDPSRVFLEIGPGQTLTSLVLQHPESGAASGRTPLALASLRHAYETQSDPMFLLQALGRYWAAGGRVDWQGFQARERRLRVPLPTYPFERRRYWIDASRRWTDGARHATAVLAAGSSEERLAAPAWRRSRPLPAWPRAGQRPERHTWLLFCDGLGIGDRLAARLAELDQEVVRIHPGDTYARTGEGSFLLDPRDPVGYETLLTGMGAAPDRVVHLWGLTGGGEDDPTAVLERGFGSLLRIAHAAAGLGEARSCQVWVVLDPIHDVHGDEALRPAHATMLGACDAITRFWPGLRCHVMDAEAPRNGGVDRLAERLLAEAGAGVPVALVADRAGQRWLPALEEITEEPAEEPLAEGGVWLLPGGLTGLGFQAARHLAQATRATLLVVVPEELAAGEPAGEGPARQRELEELGARVRIAHADLADRGALTALLAEAGDLRGVVCAAEPVLPWDEGSGLDGLIREVERAARGVLLLDELLRDRSGVRGFLLSAAREGSAVERALSHLFDALAAGEGRWVRRNLDRLQGDPEREAARLLPRLFALDAPWVVVEPPAHPREPLAAARAAGTDDAGAVHDGYVAPRNDLERHIAGIWQELLGRPRIGVHDNFLEIGGDSLLAYRLISRLRDELGVDLPVRLFFQGSTVAELAQTVESTRGAEGMRDEESAHTDEGTGGAVASSTEEIDPDALEILRMLEGLSDEDITAELASRRSGSE